MNYTKICKRGRFCVFQPKYRISKTIVSPDIKYMPSSRTHVASSPGNISSNIKGQFLIPQTPAIRGKNDAFSRVTSQILRLWLSNWSLTLLVDFMFPRVTLPESQIVDVYNKITMEESRWHLHDLLNYRS